MSRRQISSDELGLAIVVNCVGAQVMDSSATHPLATVHEAQIDNPSNITITLDNGQTFTLRIIEEGTPCQRSDA